MPTYEYLCDGCQHQFELFQPITAAPKRKCPECGRLRLRRLIGPGAAIVFKGSGFYKTDYRSDAYRKAAAAETSSGSGGNGGNGKQKAAPKAKPTAEGGVQRGEG
jgi:putative FmdB family regulatory protein